MINCLCPINLVGSYAKQLIYHYLWNIYSLSVIIFGVYVKVSLFYKYNIINYTHVEDHINIIINLLLYILPFQLWHYITNGKLSLVNYVNIYVYIAIKLSAFESSLTLTWLLILIHWF